VRCPCGLGEAYSECCGRFHTGAATAPSAELLMRSRFSAFAVGDAAYLRQTWHPSTRPRRLDLDPHMRWTRLEIVDRSGGGLFDSQGVVEFKAHHNHGVLHERSTFTKVDGRWLYVGPS
jgi:SEC-C motif-containing protein